MIGTEVRASQMAHGVGRIDIGLGAASSPALLCDIQQWDVRFPIRNFR